MVYCFTHIRRVTRHWARGFQAQFDEYLPPKRNVNWTCKNLGFRILTGKIHQLLSIGCWNDSGTKKRMLRPTKTKCSQGIAAWARDGSKIVHPKKWGLTNSRSFTNSKLEIHQPSIGVKFWLGKMECLKPEKDQWPRQLQIETTNLRDFARKRMWWNQQSSGGYAIRQTTSTNRIGKCGQWR